MLSAYLLVALLLTASAFDLYQRRVPNVLVLTGSLLGIVLLLTSWSTVSPAMALAGAVVGLLIFILPYALGLMGAGDVKLLSMCGLFLGPAAVLQAALYALLAGGLLALFFGLRRALAHRQYENTVPYALAITAGVCAFLAGY